jgi:CdiI N-terminal domain
MQVLMGNAASDDFERNGLVTTVKFSARRKPQGRNRSCPVPVDFSEMANVTAQLRSILYFSRPERSVSKDWKRVGMFSIGFTDEPLEYPYDDQNCPAAPGRLWLGKTVEDFVANLSRWDKSVYESHWKRELVALLKGSPKVTLIVDYAYPEDASRIEIWRLYRDGEWVRFQNQLLAYSSLPSEFEVSAISQYIQDRVVVTTEGHRISEWDVALRDIEEFLHRAGSI